MTDEPDLPHFEVWLGDNPDVRVIVQARRMTSARLDFLNAYSPLFGPLSFNRVRARRLDPSELAALTEET